MGDIPVGFLRPELAGIVPYEPGKPVEEVQRELGLERVVKLASNEGPFGPFPQALEALERSAGDLNRYPDGGAYRLRAALAERHSRNDRYDLEALLKAITERTKLVYVCHPNNPTGTMNSRDELDAYFERVPEHVLTVLDQAYFEYVDDPDYADGIEEYFRAGRQVIVLRTFSKIYGLAGARIGYGAGPAELVTALGKTRRAFDLTTPAQEAALASLDSPGELERRKQANAKGRAELERIFVEASYKVTGAAVGNFVFVDLGEDAQLWFEALLREGVIVRPLAGFGAPQAIRVTVGTPEEHAFLADALARVRTATAAS